MMMVSEDEQGFAIRTRPTPEEAEKQPEPVDEELARVNANDAKVKAYMEEHDHYTAAFNAIEWKERHEQILSDWGGLIKAILGVPKHRKLREDDLQRAMTERGRLLERIARHDEAVTVLSSCLDSLNRLSVSMVKDALDGRHAVDALRNLAVGLGGKPVNMESSVGELAESIRSGYRQVAWTEPGDPNNKGALADRA